MKCSSGLPSLFVLMLKRVLGAVFFTLVTIAVIICSNIATPDLLAQTVLCWAQCSFRPRSR